MNEERPWSRAEGYEEAVALGWDASKGECAKCGKSNCIPLAETPDGPRAVGMYCLSCSWAGLTAGPNATNE